MEYLVEIHRYDFFHPVSGWVMQWQTEPPTLIGDYWYWVRLKSGKIVMCFDNGSQHHPDATHWLGPLPPLEPPTESDGQ